MAQMVKLNVGGKDYFILRSRLLRYPSTRLGKLAKSIVYSFGEKLTHSFHCDAIFGDEQFFFDRSPVLFHYVAQFYRTSLIHQPRKRCLEEFLEELKYWGLVDSTFRTCGRCALPCRTRIQLATEIYPDTTSELTARELEELPVWKQRLYKMKDLIWRTTEDPQSSLFAMVFTIVSNLFILLTIFCLIIESVLPNNLSTTCDEALIYNQSNENLSNSATTYLQCHPIDWVMSTRQILDYCNLAAIVWFIMEYYIRFLACPKKITYLRCFMSIVDLLSVAPFFFELGIYLAGLNLYIARARSYKSLMLSRILRLVRLLRILRILKLLRHSAGMVIIALALKRSIGALALMAFYSCLTALITSSILFSIEGGLPNSSYSTIPAGSFWSIVTNMRFQETPPQTISGKIVTTISACAGTMLLAFPISIIVKRFSSTYVEVRNATVMSSKQKDE